MERPDKQVIRLKIMGTLLRHARLSAGRSQAELAAALHVSRHRYAQYEHGKREISLPQLERVAELCGVPLGYFFDDEAVVEEEALEIAHEVTPRIKRKVLGALLRQARLRAEKTQKECAEVLGVSARLISQYERGEKEMSTAEIQVLAPTLGVEASHFTI
jgi:transcriptional regulator with XRE-family HTH domain